MTMGTWSFPAALALMVAVAAPVAADEPGAASSNGLEPARFFDAVVDRYRKLRVYEDETEVVEVVTRDQRERRVVTRLTCRLVGDTLEVDTPGRQVRRGAGVGTAIESSPALDAMVLQYNLWLAPHMVLRFADDPLRDFRLGVPQGFTPTAVETVTVDDRALVRLDLTPAGPSPRDPDTKFELWVNPDTLLIERIKGRQRLPDGARYEMTLKVHVTESVG